MFRKLSILGLAGVLVLVGSGLTMALAGNNITQPETMVLTATTLQRRIVDIGRPGFGPGDILAFVDSLTDPADGSRVGTVRGLCTVQIGHWQTCQVGGFLDGRGEIFVSGVISTDPDFDSNLAITGGTGEFENVRGSLLLEPVANTSGSDITLSLIP